MLNEKMVQLGKVRSSIREIFEYGKRRKELIGQDKVFDFSIGNPSVPTPQQVNDGIVTLLQGDSVALHGYTSAHGDKHTRRVIAEYWKKKENADIDEDLIYITMGAASALYLCFKSISTSPQDEVLAIAPFFPEYRVFVESANMRFTVSDAHSTTLYPDIEKLEKQINKNTKAVIINSPNNPTGVIYPESVLVDLANLLRAKSLEFGNTIYLVSDEPYRELVYDGNKVPYITHFYDDTLVCYSYSKALSIPGERIGFVSVCPKMKNAQDMYYAICGSGRSSGYVCGVSLFQKLLPYCVGVTADISIYDHNRHLLYDALTEMGFDCVRPDGAFYIFMKTPCENAIEFCEKAKEYELLLVPSNDFGYTGFCRISYCVQTEQIKSALPAFRKLASFYGLNK